MSRGGAPAAEAPAPVGERARAEPARRTEWKVALAVVIGVRVAFFTVAYLARWLLSDEPGRLTLGLDIWARWDASDHFFVIAADGYSADPNGTAFFPLFPGLLKALSALGPSLVVSGLLISTVASTVAFAYLYRLAEEDLGAGAGRRAVAYLALFPTAVFLVAPYSEALFLAGAIPAFYYARRGRWGAAALPAAVATGARFAGVFVLAGLALEFVRRRKWSRREIVDAATCIAIGLLPLAAYMLWLAVDRGNALNFVTDQRLGWYREPTNPIEALRATLGTWDGDYSANWIMAWRIEVAAAAAGAGLLVIALVKREWGYAGYIGTTMAVMLASTWYLSIPRILLSLFPAVLFLAAATLGRPLRHELALLVLAPVAAIGVVVYTHGMWFF